MPMPEKSSAKIAREQRRKLVMANLLAGATYREIAEALHCSIGTVANDYKVLLRRLNRETIRDTDQYVLIECRRLDVALNAIFPKVKSGDLKAIDRMLAIMNRRARYMGLDEPVEFRLSDAELLAEYQGLLAALAAAQAAGDGDPEAESAAAGAADDADDSDGDD